ncbi:hypothetical protein HK405_008509, partial [Cladochytrium tenue]
LLNLEAVANQDAFDHPHNLLSVFPNLKKLEFLRLDGITLGPNSSVMALVMSTGVNLKAVTIDYCLEVTMEILAILWELCPNLEFIGLAGIMMTPTSDPLTSGMPGAATAAAAREPNLISERPKLRTLRFVDCDVTDDILDQVGRLATGLEMLRVVFEDNRCESVVRTWRSLTDRSLLSLAGPPGRDTGRTGSLRTLALSWCPLMTAAGLTCVLARNRLRVLDFHKDAECEIGQLDPGVLGQIVDHVPDLEVLHLYGQKDLPDSVLCEFFRRASMPRLRSVCVNNTHVSPTTLRVARTRCPLLDTLSIVDCDDVSEHDLRCFLADAESELKANPSHRAAAPWPLKRVYTLLGVERLEAEGTEEDGVNVGDGEDVDGGEATDGPDEVGRPGGFNGGASAGVGITADGPTELEGLDWGSDLRPAVADARDDGAEPMDEDAPIAEAASAETAPTAAVDALTSAEQQSSPPRPPWPACVVLENRWFVDEGLDILSLWEAAVSRGSGPGRFFL